MRHINYLLVGKIWYERCFQIKSHFLARYGLYSVPMKLRSHTLIVELAWVSVASNPSDTIIREADRDIAKR